MEDFNSKYTGEEVEQLLDQVASGNAGGGGGGITVETDPIFSGSPAADITEEKMAEWDNKYAKPSGGIPSDDLAENVRSALRNAESYKGTVIGVKANNSTKMPDGGIVDLGTVGTYSKPSTGIPQSDLAEEVKGALRKAEQYTGTVTEIKVNGNNIGASGGVVDLGNLVAVDTVGDLKIIAIQGFIDNNLYALPNAANGDEDDILLSRDTVKTINGESIVGSGDITITGGSGAVGPQGPQGDKGDKGDTGPQGEDGVGIASVKQTTTSTADGGTNVVTVTLSNGTTSTFNVKNGSKGSSGSNGTNGKDGADGEDGATFTPSVDSAGNLSWTNNKGLTNPPTVNIKGPKGDAGEGGGTSGGGGKEVIVPKASYIDELEGNKIYVLNFTTQDLIIGSFSSNTDAYETYDIIFKTVEFLLGGEFYLALPESVIWANGIIPTIEVDTVYELSIVRTTIDSIDNYSAVLTPFKPV